jgi:tetratricopeptide (TPR) repeat protein
MKRRSFGVVSLPLIDYVLIVDTGSTDATRTVVRDFLSEKNIPGEVVDEPWQNFAYNRTFALRKLREKRQIDYGLMVDADQIMVYESDFAAQRFKETLREDLYDIRLHTGSIEYLVPHLSSNRVDIAYKGVLHEYRECPDDCTRGIASGFYIQEMRDSARSTNVRKFQDDAETLQHALRNESDPFLVSRYTFYLAQSYRDFGDSESALKYYLERAELGFWDQEVFLSLYNAAQMKEALKRPETEIIETYLRAHQTCPYRAEALHGAARFCRSVGRYDQGYALARQVLHLRPPQQGAFVEAWIYQYGVRDELSVLAYWVGNYAESLDLCLSLLADGQVPEDQHARIRQNAHFAVDKINPLTLASSDQRARQASTIDDTRLPSFHHKQMAARRAAAASRYAIVTPYFRETRDKLERCFGSVRRQTVAVDHIVVADGFASGSMANRSGTCGSTSLTTISAARRAGWAPCWPHRKVTEELAFWTPTTGSPTIMSSAAWKRLQRSGRIAITSSPGGSSRDPMEPRLMSKTRIYPRTSSTPTVCFFWKDHTTRYITG